MVKKETTTTTKEALRDMGTPYFTDGERFIFHGDSRELLPLVRRVAAVVTDPPYMINIKSDGRGKLNPWADICNASTFYQWWFGECRRAIVDGGCMWAMLNWRSIVTFQKASCDLGWPMESLLVWDKGLLGTGPKSALRPAYECVGLWANDGYVLVNRSLRDIIKVQWKSTKTFHPAEKPVELMKWLIATVSGDEPILDPFMGSGTTLRAAKDMKRPAIGFEMDERHCETAARRLQQETLDIMM